MKAILDKNLFKVTQGWVIAKPTRGWCRHTKITGTIGFKLDGIPYTELPVDESNVDDFDRVENLLKNILMWSSLQETPIGLIGQMSQQALEALREILRKEPIKEARYSLKQIQEIEFESEAGAETSPLVFPCPDHKAGKLIITNIKYQDQ